MKRLVEAADRGQSTLFPECLEDWIGEDNPVRVILDRVEPVASPAMSTSPPQVGHGGLMALPET